jgi:hypothetical protein
MSMNIGKTNDIIIKIHGTITKYIAFMNMTWMFGEVAVGYMADIKIGSLGGG